MEMINAPTSSGAATGGRSTRPRLLLALSTVSLVVAIAACVVLLLLPHRQMRRLKDGSTITLEGATYGSEHRFDSRPWWERVLNHKLGVSRFYGTGVSHAVTPPDSLVFWSSHHISGKGVSLTPRYGVVTDRHGCWFEPSGTQGQSMFKMGGLSRLNAIEFAAFPRREPSVRFGLYDSYGRGPAASLRVPNPNPQVFPVWEAGPRVPVAVKEGALVFTLQCLIHRQVNLRNREAGVFQVTRDGRPQPNWRPRLVTVKDATGNSAVSTIGPRPLKDGSVRFAGLCRKEPAWKIEVTFEHTNAERILETRTVKFLVGP